MLLSKLKNYRLFENEELQSLELLPNQGFCNTNYLLKSSKQNYLVREFKSNETVNISRVFEFKMQKKASEKNLAAKPLLLNESEGFMVCNFLEGHHKDKLKKSEIKKLAKTVKKLHKIKANEKEYDLKKDLKFYAKKLKNKEAKKSLSICKKTLKKLKAFPKDLVTTHHDLNPKNILFHKNSIKFIDWEYVGVNDRFFDLATVCFEFNFSQKEQEFFLQTYSKKYKKKEMKKLQLYKTIYKHLCKLWFIKLEKDKKENK